MSINLGFVPNTTPTGSMSDTPRAPRSDSSRAETRLALVALAQTSEGASSRYTTPVTEGRNFSSLSQRRGKGLGVEAEHSFFALGSDQGDDEDLSGAAAGGGGRGITHDDFIDAMHEETGSVWRELHEVAPADISVEAVREFVANIPVGREISFDEFTLLLAELEQRSAQIDSLDVEAQAEAHQVVLEISTLLREVGTVWKSQRELPLVRGIEVISLPIELKRLALEKLEGREICCEEAGSLGKGNFAEVFLVEGEERLVAKKLLFTGDGLTSKIGCDTTPIKNLIREAAFSILIGETNPSCAVYFDLKERMIVMRKVEGTSLGQEGISFSKESLSQLLHSLSRLENLGLCHADIKPGNVIGGSLVDFNSMVFEGEDVHALTFSYIPPERKVAESGDGYYSDITHKWDIWALGLVAYKTLAGKDLIEMDSREDTSDDEDDTFGDDCAFETGHLEILETLDAFKENQSLIDTKIDALDIGQSYKNLLKLMLQADPEKRASASRLLESEPFRAFTRECSHKS